MSTNRKSPEVTAEQHVSPVRVDIYDRRQEDRCGCQGHCWLAKNSPSLMKKYNSSQILSVVKCRHLCQRQRAVLEAEAA